MNIYRFVPWALILILSVAAQPASADGWLWKPFVQGGEEDVASTPGPTGAPIVRTAFGLGSSDNSPGMFTRLNRGTKRFVSRTKTALTPGWMRSGSKKANPSTPWSNWNAEAKAPKAKKSTWFGSWFGREEPKQPETVADWLSQERPD